ncbi:hypothetical protein [Methylobacterium nodulans]|uniref:Uncharacterized protein n=1 Tax=Methylobacterium nodulans (strain LMG 21967 / CNCM I-2342 / ORS 2060) TaxID=460265 RepID=B8IDW7_METNO|nr:hypothetical protein [Methylobacterium nodulans]ACL55689.1 conserved hypothetical protein [Methylobacterium nodulans ORS 2060]
MPDRGYAARREREGWGVYAVHTGEPVRVNGRVQTGLSREAATQLAASLKILAFIEDDTGDRRVIRRYSIH